MSTILVTGATGKVGTATVLQLARLVLLSTQKTNTIIRAGVRDFSKVEEKFKGLNVPIEYFNTETSDSNPYAESQLKEAYKGVNAVLIIPPVTGTIHVGLSYVDAAKEAGVEFIGLISVASADNDRVLFGRQYKKIESAVISTGIPYAIFRCPFFLQNYYDILSSVTSLSEFHLPVNPDSRYTAISVNDVGEAAATVLFNYKLGKYNNKVYLLTCGKTICNKELAQLFTSLLGKQVNFMEYPDAIVITAMIRMGYPPWQAEGMVELWHLIDQKDKSHVESTNDFMEITGHHSTNPEQFIQAIIEH